jgi:hypothetical protein
MLPCLDSAGFQEQQSTWYCLLLMGGKALKPPPDTARGLSVGLAASAGDVAAKPPGGNSLLTRKSQKN